MPFSLVDLYLLFPAFLLVLFRVSGLVLAAPMFSSTALPLQFKTLLTLAIAVAVFPLSREHLPASVTLSTYLAGLPGELAIGLFLGMSVSVVLVGAQFAGQMIAYQAGLGLGNVFNPMLESSSSPLSQLYFFIAVMAFLGVGGDHALIETLLQSFATAPPLSFRVTEDLVALLVGVLEVAFIMAIRVGGPTVVALMLAFLTLGFVSRTIPQLNILTIGFPLKAALALLMMALTMVGLESALLEGLTSSMDAVRAGLGVPPVG